MFRTKGTGGESGGDDDEYECQLDPDVVLRRPWTGLVTGVEDAARLDEQ
jgi:hypothetical protein